MYHPNDLKKMRVDILTVDPRTRTVEGLLKDGNPITLAVWETGPFFRWPREGEEWTAIYESNFWRLGDFIGTDQDTLLNELMPGEGRIDSDKLYISGEAFVLDQKVVTDDDPRLMDIVTQAELDAHAIDTTGIHGIADTSALVLTTDPRLSNSRTPTGAAGGELAGTYPNPTLSGALAAGRVFTWGGDTNLYRSEANVLMTDGSFKIGGNLSATAVGLTVKGAASQIANLQEWQNSAGVALASVSAAGNVSGVLGSFTGYVNVGSNIFMGGTLYLDATATKARIAGPNSVLMTNGLPGSVTAIVRGAASQTANLQEWRDSAGTALASIGPAGALTAKRALFTADITTANTLTAQAIASQTGLVQQWLGSAGTLYMSVNAAGRLQNYSASLLTDQNVNNQGPPLTVQGFYNQVTSVVKGAASQTANLQEWQDNTGTVLASVSAGGAIRAASYAVGATPLASTHLSDSAALARLASPAFTGTPTAPTAAAGTSTIQIATTEFVMTTAASGGPPTGAAGGVLSGTYPDPEFAVDMATQSELDSHTTNTSNPHNVTKTQVGLGNVDNTSDIDKPVSTAQQAAFDLKANLASPTFTGTPAAPTAAADTNTTQLATTGFVLGQASTVAPLMDGAATVGTSLRFAREGHIHPTDTSRAPLASPTFTGVPAAPTPTVDTNTTQLATTAFVLGQASAATPLMDGTATVGVSTRFAREGHIHPTDTSRAPLASPVFTGIPTAPTAPVGTNTDQLATTAFVIDAATASTLGWANIKDAEWGPGGIYNHGALGDNLPHPLDDFFDTLAEAQAVYPFATSLTQQLDWAAAQKALLAEDHIYIPKGSYIASDPLTKTTGSHQIITGEGFGMVAWLQQGNADCINITLTGAAASLTISGFDFVAAANIAQITGAAIKVQGNANKPAAVISDIRVAAGGTPIGEFQYGIHLTDCAESKIENCHFFGVNTIRCIYVTAASLPVESVAGPTRIVGCSAYNVAYGVQVFNPATIAPGVEGVHVIACDWVACDYGVHAVNAHATYFPPQIDVIGGHINARIACVHIQFFAQVFLSLGLWYFSGSGAGRHVWLQNVYTAHVTHNTLRTVGTGDPAGVELSNSAGFLGDVDILDNKFQLKAGGTKHAIEGAVTVFNEGRIVGNTLESGGAGVTNIYAHPRIIIKDNYPLALADYYAFTGVSGAANDTIDLGVLRSTYVEIANPGVPRTVTTILPRREGETFRLRFLGNVTLQHGAGLLLQGQANVALNPGDIVTLTRSNGVWYESAGRMVFERINPIARTSVIGASNDTIDLISMTSTFVEIADPGTPRTVTTILPRRDGETFKLRFLGNVTLQHNAGLLLAGQTNAVMSPGDIVTLTRAEGSWFESAGRVEF